MTHGKFISIEGGEGCGKTTQTAILAERLKAAGLSVIVTREPGGTPLAEKIRALVREESDDAPNARAETLLFLAARAQICRQVIRPALASGTWVICDRFADSTFAYQGFGRGMDLDELRVLNDFATEGLKPDRTILLETSRAEALRRMHVREEATHTVADRMEKAGEGFHMRLLTGFRALAEKEPERVIRLESQPTIEGTAERIWKLIAPMI